MSNSTSTPILASFATLKSLNDSKKYINSYQILAEFIKYIIDGQKLYVFTAIEMKNRLKSVFGFDIPEAVVKTASKSLPFVTRENGTYIVDIRNFVSDHAFERAKAIAEEANTGAISLLKEYISKREPEKEIDEDLLTQDLIAFLVDDQKKSSGQYTDLISEFVLKNENNNNVQRTLETIREGSILYIGLNYNINETGNLTKKTIEHKDQVIQRQQEEKTNLESELALYRAEKDKRARRKKRAKQILRFVWSILWKIVIIAAITYIAIFFEKKLNSSIPLYICAAVDLFGLVLTAQVAIKKDIHKYLSKEDTAK